MKSLSTIWDFIALDSQQRAKEFELYLRKKIEILPEAPYIYRKSIYFDDETIRDCIFKGYVIPYKISDTKIVLLGMTKYRRGL